MLLCAIARYIGRFRGVTFLTSDRNFPALGGTRMHAGGEEYGDFAGLGETFAAAAGRQCELSQHMFAFRYLDRAAGGRVEVQPH